MPSEAAAREILARLVAFPTVSSDSNIALVDYLADLLAGAGIAVSRMPDATGTKRALFASVGPDAPGGVVLSGHTDVVPVAGQSWTTDPFTLTEREGRLYGRGTCDMKGFDALAVAALLAASARPLKRPLQLALTFDEEVGCIGAPPLIDHIAASGLPRAETVIVGEPSMMKVVTGHKGSIGYDIRVRGHEVHSSLLHTGVSAILEAGRLIGWANDTNAANRAAPPGPLAAAFDPPWTTLHVGLIAGGTAHNITAAECRLELEIRVVPGQTEAEWDAAFRDRVAAIEAGMRAVHPGAGIEVTEIYDVPGLVPEEAGKAEALARRLTGDNGTHVVSYGTEAGQFQAAGYSAVICGPGDIAQAHQPDEYLSLSQFRAGWRFMEELLDWLSR